MRIKHSILISLLGLLGSLSTTVTGFSEKATPLEILEKALTGRARNILGESLPNNQPTATRDLCYGALALLASGDNTQAQELLNDALSVQDMDPSSQTYGTFNWYYNSDAVTDNQADEFVGEALGPIWAHYRDRFSSSFQTTLLQHLQALTSALLRETANIGDTNIYLMRTIDLLLIGQATGSDAAIQTGQQTLQAWTNYTQECKGIHEYESPTYYSVDLASLTMGYLYIDDPTLHSTLENILNEFWVDIKANYFYGKQDLSGAHSRDYDFLLGTGGILYYLWTEGKNSWYTTDANLVEMEQVFVLENGLASGGYHPDWDALPGISGNTPKWTDQISDIVRDANRDNWVTPDFALGSASLDYGPEDKLINLELASPKPKLPDISVVPDIYDDPYGLKITEAQGHRKTQHAPLSPACVQHQGMLLTLLNLNPAALGPVSNFATNILLPGKADSITVDGNKVSLTHVNQIPVTAQSWIGVREGQAAVLMRMFWVDNLGTTAPVMILQADRNGISSGAARLTAYHFQGSETKPQQLAPTQLKVGILIVAYHCESNAEWNSLLADAEASQVTAQTVNGNWQVRAQVRGPEGGDLQIVRSLANPLIFTRSGGGGQ